MRQNPLWAEGILRWIDSLTYLLFAVAILSKTESEKLELIKKIFHCKEHQPYAPIRPAPCLYD
jgi:hypothetical protein